MLRLRTLHRSNGSYYLMTTPAGGADPDGLVEPDGRWTGSLAEEFAIGDAVVDRDGLVNAFKGRDPANGHPLDTRHARVSVGAIDCVFAAPKSVSVLHALGSDEVGAIVRQAHIRAVEGALGFLERNAAFVRRRGNLVEATGLLAAAFVHRTSRAPDPHLHTHLLVTNLGADGSGRWSALDGRPIYAQAGGAGSLYRSGLRREISDHLDIAWERRVEGFADLIGISKAALRGFSQRSDEIDAELQEIGQWSRRSKEIASDLTRSAKQLDVSYETLVRQWRERALDLGVARSTMTRLSTPSRSAAVAGRDDHRVLVRAVETSVSSFDRPFTR
ncbi:MAG: MobF family relaxase, partial [Acidimicrobiales bacterium]